MTYWRRKGKRPFSCFNVYLKRFKKREDESSSYCESFVENAEHTLCVCARWGAEREAVGRAVGAKLTPDTMVSLMLQSEEIWMLIESFVTLVMKTRELDGFRGEIALFLPWPARIVSLPNGRVAADGSPGRTDDERVVRDFKLEATTREV